MWRKGNVRGKEGRRKVVDRGRGRVLGKERSTDIFFLFKCQFCYLANKFQLQSF